VPKTIAAMVTGGPPEHDEPTAAAPLATPVE